jgi:hypothetical protein
MNMEKIIYMILFVQKIQINYYLDLDLANTWMGVGMDLVMNGLLDVKDRLIQKVWIGNDISAGYVNHWVLVEGWVRVGDVVTRVDG